MKSLLNLVATTFVVLFAAVWLVIAWRLWQFSPTTGQTKLGLSDPVITTAGFLAATVGAGTAAVLGIKIADVSQQGEAVRDHGETRTISARVAMATSESPLLVVGIAVYLLVGVVTLATWLLNPDEAPELTSTMAVGILGWAGGAFSAVYKSKV